MKTRTISMDYDSVMDLPFREHVYPKAQPRWAGWLLKTLSAGELKKVHFTHRDVGMEKIDKGEPCLYLMNHSSFIDLEIASALIYPRPFHIVCTSDGFVGKEWLMRTIGCIPTNKFVTDLMLLKDIYHVVKKLGSSVLMYPEASYSFDGTATPLPEGVGKIVKKLGIPVVMITTKGAFLRDPLYNNLQIRKVDVSAVQECLFDKEQVKNLSVEEIREGLNRAFDYDHFRVQKQEGILVTEPFRADYLNRVLYKCPHCMTEGKMLGKGTLLSCGQCRKVYELTEFGEMKALEGETEFSHIPDWYAWERQQVRLELENGDYSLKIPVKIGIMKDMKAIYMVGEGELCHSADGFLLTGCGGRLRYTQGPMASYSLYADYYWYEIGDVICIGDQKTLYYCFPQGEGDVVAKTRLACEELYARTRKNTIRTFRAKQVE